MLFFFFDDDEEEEEAEADDSESEETISFLLLLRCREADEVADEAEATLPWPSSVVSLTADRLRKNPSTCSAPPAAAAEGVVAAFASSFFAAAGRNVALMTEVPSDGDDVSSDSSSSLSSPSPSSLRDSLPLLSLTAPAVFRRLFHFHAVCGDCAPDRVENEADPLSEEEAESREELAPLSSMLRAADWRDC